MTYQELDKYLLSREFSDKRIIKNWSWIRYTTQDELFAVISIVKGDKAALMLNSRTANVQKYRRAYPNKIVPALSLDTDTWSMIYLESDVPETFIKSMIEESYSLANDSQIKMRITSNGNSSFDYKKVINEFDFDWLFSKKPNAVGQYLKLLEEKAQHNKKKNP